MLVISKYRNMVALLAIVVPTIFLFSCKSNDEEKVDLPEYKHVPISTSTNFRFTYTDSARVTLKFKSPELIIDFDEGKDEKKNRFKLCTKGFVVERYNNDGVMIGHISADYGKEYEYEHKYEARGNVVVYNEKGDTLKTEHLIYLQQDKRIYSDVFVKIIQKDRIITGDRFESDENFENRVLYNSNIRMDIEEKSIKKETK
ncbi:LPS export ABC transporter periplasmic protein LptC [Halosquirtibacter laminarini]|uniref:LPS export ABC transporter periplasmic protein LptC n=1 Tax=Halosquirtibacter laminarini TaxID=3374600 RepID=A0AC61ND64_9BACT|nr:LPS export ABC transporter periplasmic protein LptC [Prolixibacteraceae bacterium]